MIKRWNFLLIAIVLLIMMAPGTTAAEEEHEGHEGVHGHQHRLELFLGNTHDEGEDGFTVGIGYEYRLNEILGIGGLVEHVGGDLNEFIGAVPLFIHPYKGWIFILAPGFDYRQDRHDFLFRAGVAYEFEIGRWSITPAFNVDFVEGEEVLVYGLSFGYGF